MEKNDFLLYNEIIYHIHTCQDMDDLKRSILAQVKLMIPYTYASLIVVEIDPETRRSATAIPSACRTASPPWRRPGSTGITRTRAFGSATPPSPSWSAAVT